MAKEKTKAALATPELPGLKRSRGRPHKEGGPESVASRVAKLRAKRKEQGLCPCCGQSMPVAVNAE